MFQAKRHSCIKPLRHDSARCTQRITSSLEILGTEGVGVELERWVMYGLVGKAKMLDDNLNTLGSIRGF